MIVAINKLAVAHFVKEGNQINCNALKTGSGYNQKKN